jgi:benzoyl-CoA reductase/2-hydroxyglutaryl-CoA dehydratase subunit BcrC/BadD/HgdB
MEEYGYETYMADVVERPKNMSDKRELAFKNMLSNEYVKFARWMSGNDIDKNKLKIELERSNRMKDKVSYLESLEKKHNQYLGTMTSMLARCGVESYYAQPILYEEILEELIEEMDNLPEGAYHDSSIPKIIWSGARGVDFSAFTAVDLVGGQVVYWNLVCNLEKRYDLSLDPFEALINYDYESSGTSSIEEMCQLDERYMRENDGKGIILFQTQGCTYNSLSFELRRREFSKKKLPVLLLTGNTQYGEINGQTLMRMEAFIEMLH